MLSGCMSTGEDEPKYITKDQSMKKDQYMLKQAIEYKNNENYKKAIEILTDLANKGMPEAKGFLGKMHHMGDGVEKNVVLAEKLYLDSSKNYDLSLYLLARLYKEEKDLEGYDVYLDKAAMAGVLVAIEIKSLELFLEKDKVGLINWSEKTKELKYNVVFNNYLIDFLTKETEDSKEVLFWLKKLSSSNNNLAQYKYGIGYVQGLYGLKKNNKKAIYWLKKSALNKNIMAQRDLGMLHMKEKDYLNAYIMFSMYAQTQTLESIKFKTLALSKLSQAEVTNSTKILTKMLKEHSELASKG